MKEMNWSCCFPGGKAYMTTEWRGAAAYVKEALEAGGCKTYLPVRFMEQEEKVTVCYENTGWIGLGEYCQREADQGRSLLRPMIRILRLLAEDELEAEDFLLSRDESCYCLQTIFLQEDGNKTAMAYLPALEADVFLKRIFDLLEEITETFGNVGLRSLKEGIELEAQRGQLGTAALLRLLSRWEREV